MKAFMQRCLELAAHGKGNVAPNPMVGAVIVSNEVIIGEGYHRCFGEAHAEVNAIASVHDETLLRNATMYTNLEPCSHYGKTSPCVELIIRKRIPRVVIACLDPYPEVAGRGMMMLRNAGIDVTTCVLEQEALELNRFFMTAHKRHRPYIILKWAQSADGYIDRYRKDVSEKPTQFSTPLTRMITHQLRSEVQAIMVGTNTAIMDDPSLMVRHWVGKSPIRILIDRHLRVPRSYRLFNGWQQTLVFTKLDAKSRKERGFQEKENVKYLKIDDACCQLRDLTEVLYENGIQSLLVEGGASLHHSFIVENLWDEMIIETAPVRLERGIKSAAIPDRNNIQLIDKQYIVCNSNGYGSPSVMERFVNRTV